MFTCTITDCSKKYNNKSNLNRHLKNDHNVHLPSKKLRCPMCIEEPIFLGTESKFDDHLEQIHQILIEVDERRFENITGTLVINYFYYYIFYYCFFFVYTFIALFI